MIHCEGFSGAAHTGHDFVGDENNSTIAADFCYALDVAIGRSCSAERGTDYRFEDEGRDGRGVVCNEERFEIVGAGDVAGWKSLAERTAVAEAGSDVAPVVKQRLVRCAASDVAADGHGAEGAAVVALAARDNTEFLRCSRFEMELADKFDGGFGGFRTAGCEIDATVCKIWRR